MKHQQSPPGFADDQRFDAFAIHAAMPLATPASGAT
jgi:hypothetical protein